jgi:hypothetical protein
VIPGIHHPFYLRNDDLRAKLTRLATDQRTLLLIYSLAALTVTIQRGVFGFPNDFAIYRAAFWNLVHNQDLYVLRMDQAHDYFKYSPTFALLFAPFAAPPFVVGLFLWNLANALSIFFALRMLLPAEQWPIAHWLVFLPTLRSMQSSQSNALVAALLIFAFVSFERGRLWQAGWTIAVGTLTKIFPLVAAVFALPRPDRKPAILIGLTTMTILIVIPLVIISPAGLLSQYQSWGGLERTEAGLVTSSMMQLIRDAGVTWPAWPIQVLGAAVLLALLILRRAEWKDRSFRLQFLGFVMVFCVVFNHRAERQSAVIALAGMVIWHLSSRPPRAGWRTVLVSLVYVLVAVSSTSVVPDALKQLLGPTIRFSAPLSLLWLVMVGDLVRTRSTVYAIERD